MNTVSSEFIAQHDGVAPDREGRTSNYFVRKYLRFVILLFIAVAIAWFFFRGINWSEVAASLRAADPLYLVIAFAGISLGYLLRAKRWQVLLEPITQSNLRELFATTTVGYAAILVVGRAGEIVRPMWLPMRDRRVRPSAALVTIFVERMFDLASLFIFFSISLIWFNAPPDREAEFASIKLIGNLMLAGILLGFAAMYVYHRFSDRVIAWAERASARSWMPVRVRSTLLSLMRQAAAALDILRSPREIFGAVFWTTALWFAIALPTWLIIRAFGLEMSFIDSIFVMGVASLGSLIPTPGGAAGAFHAATAGSLMLLDVDKDRAAAISIIMHLIYFTPALLFGLYYFLRGDISMQRFRSLLSSENAEREIESDSPDFEAK